MSRRKENPYYEEGNGYRINAIPSNANYNTCSIRYALNHDFNVSPKVQYNDSTNTHTRRPHIDVDASTNEQRPSGAYCSRPISTRHTMNNRRPSVKNVPPARYFILPIVLFIIFILAVMGKDAIPFIAIIAAVIAKLSSKGKTNRKR